jgi:YbbR domain-containing protein
MAASPSVSIHRVTLLGEEFHEGIQEIEDDLAVGLSSQEVDEGDAEVEVDHCTLDDGCHTSSIVVRHPTRKANRLADWCSVRV